MIDWGNVPSWLSALGALATVCVALLAARVAFSQLHESRTLRIEQAAPYVVIDFEPLRSVGGQYMELVIKNTGLTAALDVGFCFDPPLATTFDTDSSISPVQGVLREHAIFAKGVPSMAPGREYRILFDDMAERHQAELARTFSVRITYVDSLGNSRVSNQVIDLDLYYGRVHIEQHGTHHIAKTLRSWAKKQGVHNF